MLDNLDKLSNEEVKESIIKLRSQERDCEVDLLHHLVEIEKRDLHLAWGYSSLFTYLVNSLGYSEACASRRVRVSRLISKYPEIPRMLRAGETNLTSLSLVSKVLEDDLGLGNSLLSQIANKPSREVEELVQAFKPEVPKLKEFIRPVKVMVSKAQNKSDTSKNLTNLFCNLQESPKEEEIKSQVPCSSEVRFEVRCTLSKDVRQKLSQAQNLMVHKLKGDMALENVFNELLDCYLGNHSKERKVRKVTRVAKNVTTESEASSRRKAIPASVKREVFARDQYCCSYRSEGGTKCCKTSNLEIDHITPVALGGDNSLSNLRLVCREHNQFLARKIFGREFVECKILTL